VTFENHIVQGLILPGAEGIPPEIRLDLPLAVLYLNERSIAHDAPAHDPSGKTYLLEVVFLLIEIIQDLHAVCVHFIPGGRVGIDPEAADLPE